jgi:acetyl-CoA carboxylase biotin carboxyl carrier protein
VSATDGDAVLSSAGVAAADLSALLELIGGTDVVELDVSVGPTRMRLRRTASAAPAPSVVSNQLAAEDASLAITSPLVGVFRASVGIGADLDAGQSIGVVEALGLPTHVEAPHAGTVEDLLVASGSPVEYGQPLLVLRRARPTS